MLNFKEFYSQEQYQKLSENFDNLKIKDVLFKTFFDSLYNFIKQNIESGYIKPAITSHKNHIIAGFNNLFQLKENNCDQLFHNLIFYSIFSKEEVIQIRYDKLCELITSGNIPTHYLSSGEKCQDCDQYLNVVLNNWKIELSTYTNRERVEPEECIDKSNQSLIIEFKTSELLIADWFRIKEFTDVVEYNKDYKLPSLCSFAGRVNSAKYFIEEQGFVHIQLTNCSTTVITDGKDLLFGDNYDSEKDEEGDLPSGYKELGSVCCDLWAVTVIEKQKLIDILSTKMDNAVQIVNDYIDNEDVLCYNIDVGTYQVDFNGDFEDFHEKSGSTIDFYTYFSIKQTNKGE